MQQDTLADEVRAYLERAFPESSIDSGYDFVAMRSRFCRDVSDEGRATLMSRLHGEPCWIVAVGFDPRSLVKVSKAQQQDTTYSPDWDVREPVERWFVETTWDAAALGAVLDAMPYLPRLSALAFIAPSRDVVLANGRRLYARTEHDLERALEPAPISSIM